MSRLVDLIDAYRDAHGSPSEASVARAIGAAPQTVNSWRNRGIRELPEVEIMQRLATYLGVPYRTVLEAALVDAKYASTEEYPAPEAPEPVRPVRRRRRRA